MLARRATFTTSSSTSRPLATYDQYSLDGLSVLEYIQTTGTNTTTYNRRFTALEIGIGEGRAILELQQMVPEAAVVGINKPMPQFSWRTSVVQSADDLRHSATLYGLTVSGTHFPEVLLSNATDRLLMQHRTSSSRLVISQHVYHYFTRRERSALFEQIRRILDKDLGLSYVAWPAAGTMCEPTIGALKLLEGRPVLLGCERVQHLVNYKQCFYLKRMTGSNSPSAANGGCKRHMHKWACRSGRYHMVVSVQVTGESMVERLDRAMRLVTPISDAKALRAMVICLIQDAGSPA